MRRFKRLKSDHFDTPEGHANLAVCAPSPILIHSKGRRLVQNEDEESSAPPATPLLVQKVPGSSTMLETFSDVLKSSRL